MAEFRAQTSSAPTECHSSYDGIFLKYVSCRGRAGLDPLYYDAYSVGVELISTPLICGVGGWSRSS